MLRRQSRRCSWTLLSQCCPQTLPCRSHQQNATLLTGDFETAAAVLDAAEAAASAAGQERRFGSFGGLLARGQLPQLLRVAVCVVQARLVSMGSRLLAE